MPDRLTTQLDDGSLEHLRELAGGERKVGAYLSGVVAWLWQNKAQLETAPLADYTLTATTFAGRIREMLDPEWDDDEATERMLSKLDAIAHRIDELETRSSRLTEKLETANSRLVDELETANSRVSAFERLTPDELAVRVGQLQDG